MPLGWWGFFATVIAICDKCLNVTLKAMREIIFSKAPKESMLSPVRDNALEIDTDRKEICRVVTNTDASFFSINYEKCQNMVVTGYLQNWMVTPSSTAYIFSSWPI